MPILNVALTLTVTQTPTLNRYH